MQVDKFCNCCQEFKKTYKNGKTGKINTYCMDCQNKYTAAERKKMVFLGFFDVIKDHVQDAINEDKDTVNEKGS